MLHLGPGLMTWFNYDKQQILETCSLFEPLGSAFLQGLAKSMVTAERGPEEVN